jgi:MFS family permease
VANGIAFSVCTDIMGDFERAFQLTKLRAGEAVSWGAIGGVAVLVVGGALLDVVGIGTTLWLALAAHVAGVTTVIFAGGFWTLALGWLFLALASGLVEASINPLAATMYPEQKTHVLNVLHAWWPGGLIIGGLLAFGFSEVLKRAGASEALLNASWQIKMALVYVPVVIYAFLIFGQKFPKTERAQAGVSASAMWREALRPLFLFLVFCMFLTASTELAPNRWVGVFINDIVGIRGVLFLVYASGLMFVLRFFAGPLARAITPVGILVASSVLSALGLLALSYSTTVFTVFLAATVFGIGVTYYWPTMLGVTAERFPKGGALLLGIIGAAGGLFWSYVATPGMGKLHDHYTLSSLPPAVSEKVVAEGRVDEEKEKALPEGEKKVIEEARRTAAMTTFRWVAVLPAALILLFGALLLYDMKTNRVHAELGGQAEKAEPRTNTDQHG